MKLRAKPILVAILLIVAVATALAWNAPLAAQQVASDYEEIGYASWYGKELKGRRTASGDRFNPDGASAAHRSLPMPSYLEVTALATGRTILVHVNDRGPFTRKRLIDISHGAAKQLGIAGHGHFEIHIRRVEPSEEEKAALRAGKRIALRDPHPPERIAAMREQLQNASKSISSNSVNEALHFARSQSYPDAVTIRSVSTGITQTERNR